MNNFIVMYLVSANLPYFFIFKTFEGLDYFLTINFTELERKIYFRKVFFEEKNTKKSNNARPLDLKKLIENFRPKIRR